MTGLFLGVDGGGSGTRFCLLDARGEVLAEAAGASTYYFTEGIDLVAQVLRQGIHDVCTTAGSRPEHLAHAFLGLPGYGESSADRPHLDAVPAVRDPAHIVQIGRDPRALAGDGPLQLHGQEFVARTSRPA